MRKKYRYVTVAGHPYAKENANGCQQIPEHRYVAEKAFGHYIHPRHPIHHVNGNSLDNSPENLVICENSRYHWLLHMRQRALDGCGNPNWFKCRYCGAWDDPIHMKAVRAGVRPRMSHATCEKAYYAGPRNERRRRRAALLRSQR